jgi:hypothetical protein
MRIVSVFVVVAAGSVVMAQTSTSYKLTEFTFNNGGDPANGGFASSASHQIRLDAVGEAVVAVSSAGTSHRMDGGFVGQYAPPGEVKHARFTNSSTLVWDPEKSIGSYDAYRALLSSLSSLGYGSCLQNGLTAETVTDAVNPSAGQGFFYLATARNRLGEIGTKGFASSGLERANPTPCP